MDGISIDRRRVLIPREREWKRQLSPAQQDTLRALEQVGWTIRFVRNSGPHRFAAVYDPDHRKLAVIEPDGQLIENPIIEFRR